MPLKFTPSSAWSVRFGELRQELAVLDNPRKIDLVQCFNDIYLDKTTFPGQPLEKLLDAADETQAEKIAGLFMELWNLTPREAFGGKTPGEMAAGLAAQGSARRQNPGWTKVMELLLHAQGNFQVEFYAAVRKLGDRQQELAVRYAHRLFGRYLHTLLAELLPDQAAPADLVAAALEHERVILPKDTQVQIRVLKTPVKNPAPDRRLRMVVGEETVGRFPLISDYSGRRKTSELYSGDLYYNRMLTAVSKRRPQTEAQCMAAAWEYAVEGWRSSSLPLRRAYGAQEWRAWWVEQFDRACKGWVSTDEIFAAIIQRLHLGAVPIQAPEGRFVEPQGPEDLAAYMLLFETQISYARDFIDPLITYLPLLEVRYIEPLVIREELDGMSVTAQDFVGSISKPPSYFALRAPLGRRLWRRIKKELR